MMPVDGHRLGSFETLVQQGTLFVPSFHIPRRGGEGIDITITIDHQSSQSKGNEQGPDDRDDEMSISD
jgi:hypothetical protein